MPTNNPIQTAVEQSKAIEKLLTTKFKAVGRGLTEKVKSIEYNLPVNLVQKIKTIARIRNNVVHEDGSLLENENHFLQICEEIKVELSNLPAFKPQLKSALEVLAYDDDFKAFYKQYCEENRGEDASLWTISIFIGLVFGFTVHGVMIFWGLVLSICILKFLHVQKVKEMRSPSIYKFYSGKFTVDSPLTDHNPVNEVLYQEVKNIRLVDNDKNILSIRTYNRGVSEEFKLNLVESSQSAKQICQQIHELVFRGSSPSNETDSNNYLYKEGMRESYKSAAGVTGLAGTAYILSQSNNETSAFAELDDSLEAPSINPANGLPMLGAVDIEGNPYGTDTLDNMIMETDAIGYQDSMADSFDSSDLISSSDSFDSFDSFDNQY